MTVLNFPQRNNRAEHWDQLRMALWLVVGDLEAMHVSGHPLNEKELQNLEYAKAMLGDWKPRPETMWDWWQTQKGEKP